VPPLANCASSSYKPNWERKEMKKREKIEDKHAESWGQVGWVLRWRHTAAAFTSFLFFPISLLLFGFLYKI
jgi:hypothetical protein